MDTRKIAALISDVRANINRFLIRELNRCGVKGLAPSHGAILFHLYANEIVTMKELSTAVRRDKSTVTALVAKLVAGGYIQKQTSLDDQRKIYIRLTQKGEQLKPIFEEISNNLLRRVWKGIDAAEQKEMVRILKKIASNF